MSLVDIDQILLIIQFYFKAQYVFVMWIFKYGRVRVFLLVFLLTLSQKVETRMMA